MVAIPEHNPPKKRPVWTNRIVDGAMSALSVAAISFGLLAPRLATQPAGSRIEVRTGSPSSEITFQVEEISLGPLLDTLGSTAFQEQQTQWAKEKAFKALAEAEEQAAFLLAEASDSAAAAATDALNHNYAVATVQLHRPPGYEYRTQRETIVDSTQTKTGCDVVLTQKDDPSKQALMTNLAPGSCLPDGTYPAGTVFGKQGEFAVGKRIY
jgi:hypothetical protein